MYTCIITPLILSLLGFHRQLSLLIITPLIISLLGFHRGVCSGLPRQSSQQHSEWTQPIRFVPSWVLGNIGNFCEEVVRLCFVLHIKTIDIYRECVVQYSAFCGVTCYGFTSVQKNIESFRGFIEKFGLFLNLSETLHLFY